MLSFSMIMILVSFAVFAFLLYFRFQHLNHVHSEPIHHSSQQLSSDELLEFDREINKILNNPHLSNVDKERLTNEYAEQYLLKNAMDEA
ncbi:hypothetical protein A7P53_12130 [Acinetobacter defluvii]|uniref:Uncharacterized protein n=1 Tax=Acinetobacter defluvii TaxID=1871111 RepID=A0A2S2FBI0_9GAMM|nr:hypothetical protein [Acinetobacter defluvii]AWL28336.1 hypothetical protein DJ533_07020 [Acinetobacter defluvii]NNP73310.1 hypothetical protein [Acinetobacter defluvii]